MKRVFITALLLVTALLAWGQLTLQVNSVPANTPSDATIFVAGNFNGWSEGAPAYALTQQEAEAPYTITIEPAAGELEFKFTRGSWQTVEGNASGGFRPNRTFSYDGTATTLELDILSWEGSGNTTAASNVTVLSETFEMPQLGRSRRIWVYLPPDYEESNQSYPVLYMHDGQNLFDAATSAFGEWEVDKTLNALFENGDEGVIVVGIDNGGVHRLDEYSPWVNAAYGGGEGDAYLDFIVETLKPHIDGQYRTRPEAEHTGMMGSSMGGLITLYAALRHPEVFSKAGVFSASFWFADEVYDYAASATISPDTKMYMIAGALEGGGQVDQVADMEAMRSTLLGAGMEDAQLKVVTHPDGEHSEWYWRREFGPAYEWLFANSPTGIKKGSMPAFLESFEVFPNPTDRVLHLRFGENWRGLSVAVVNAEGKRVKPYRQLSSPALEIGGLAPGWYFVEVYRGAQLLGVKQVLRQ